MISVNPCPFCGFNDVEYSEVEPGTYAVDCPECQCIGPFADTTDEAAVKWNKVSAPVYERAAVLTEMCQKHEREIERLRIAEQDLAHVRKLRCNDANEIIRLEGLIK